MEDGNLEDFHLDWIRTEAQRIHDKEADYLADKLLELTEEARMVLYNEMWKI